MKCSRPTRDEEELCLGVGLLLGGAAGKGARRGGRRARPSQPVASHCLWGVVLGRAGFLLSAGARPPSARSSLESSLLAARCLSAAARFPAARPPPLAHPPEGARRPSSWPVVGCGFDSGRADKLGPAPLQPHQDRRPSTPLDRPAPSRRKHSRATPTRWVGRAGAARRQIRIAGRCVACGRRAAGAALIGPPRSRPAGAPRGRDCRLWPLAQRSARPAPRGRPRPSVTSVPGRLLPARGERESRADDCSGLCTDGELFAAHYWGAKGECVCVCVWLATGGERAGHDPPASVCLAGQQVAPQLDSLQRSAAEQLGRPLLRRRCSWHCARWPASSSQWPVASCQWPVGAASARWAATLQRAGKDWPPLPTAHWRPAGPNSCPQRRAFPDH